MIGVGIKIRTWCFCTYIFFFTPLFRQGNRRSGYQERADAHKLCTIVQQYRFVIADCANLHKKLLKTKQIKVLSCKHHTTISVVAYDSFQPEGKDELNPNWVKLYRKIEDWRWYKDAITFHLFIHLLLNVNYCPSANGENILGRGQIMVTRRSLTESTNISDRSIRTCIEKLQNLKKY